MQTPATKEVKARAVAMYREKVPVREISRRIGITPSCICRWAREAGVTMRNAVVHQKSKHEETLGLRSVDTYSISRGSRWERSWAENSFNLET